MEHVIKWLYTLGQSAKAFGTGFFEFINYEVEAVLLGQSYTLTIGELIMGPMLQTVLVCGIAKWLVDALIPN